jgi:hypothetical protein
LPAKNGIDFIAMKYVPGEALNQLIQRKGLPLSESLKYAIVWQPERAARRTELLSGISPSEL